MKKFDKEFHFRFISILITNYLKLGVSIKKTPAPFYKSDNLFHINFFTCQVQIKRGLQGYCCNHCKLREKTHKKCGF